jgi:hypothetical protein
MVRFPGVERVCPEDEIFDGVTRVFEFEVSPSFLLKMERMACRIPFILDIRN